MSRYDVVVIGGGPNGLAAATVLAQAGRKVAVAESRSVFGGLAAGEEFHPGFTSPGIHHDTTRLRPFVVEALGLGGKGLEFMAGEDLWALDGAGGAVHLTDDGSELDPKDREGLARWNAFVDKARPALTAVLDDQPRDVLDPGRSELLSLLKPAWQLRRLGAEFMMELFRVPPMCAADWVSEFVQSPPLQAALAYDGVVRTFGGPWSPGTAGDLLLHRVLRGPRVRGGARAVARALENVAREAGVTLLADTPVQRILVDENRVQGVATQGGDTLEAPTVLATCDPRRALGDLLDPARVPYHIQHHVTHYRGEGIGAKVHLALKGLPRWKGVSGPAPERLRIMASLDAVEQSFDPVKYGAHAPRPVLDVTVPSVGDPSLAPAGCAVASVWVHGVPYALEGGWRSEDKEGVLDSVLRVLDEAAQGFRESVAGWEVLTPADLEDRYGAVRGHIYHGDHALDQLLIRPIPECSRYQTFIPGLYLGGSGSFPGGGLSGAPGVLSARRVQAG